VLAAGDAAGASAGDTEPGLLAISTGRWRGEVVADVSKNRVLLDGWQVPVQGPRPCDSGLPLLQPAGGCLPPPNPSAVPGGQGQAARLWQAPSSPCVGRGGKSHLVAPFPDTPRAAGPRGPRTAEP